jgi:RHS repeat-associated protein
VPAGQDQVGFGGKYGYYQDPTGLYLLGCRYYDPTNARFLTRDPTGYQAGPNLYAYCGDNPITRSDPEGTSSSGGSWFSDFVNWMGHMMLPHGTKTFSSGSSEKQQELAELTRGDDEGGVNSAISEQQDYHMVANAKKANAGIRNVEQSAGENTLGMLSIPEGAEAKAVNGVIAETLAGRGNITSAYKLTTNEALDAGIKFLGPGYKEIAHDVYRNAGETRQFRIDDNSILGNHTPNVPHFHLELVGPNKRTITVSNHIPFGF